MFKSYLTVKKNIDIIVHGYSRITAASMVSVCLFFLGLPVLFSTFVVNKRTHITTFCLLTFTPTHAGRRYSPS